MARRNRTVAPSRINDGYSSPKEIQSYVRQEVLLARLRSGPLPSSDELAAYDVVVPGMAERLLKNLEKQTDHRIDIEKKVIEGDIRRADRGLIAGWTFAMALLGASLYLIANGHESIGVTGLLGELAILGGSLVYSHYQRRQERNRKAGG